VPRALVVVLLLVLGLLAGCAGSSPSADRPVAYLAAPPALGHPPVEPVQKLLVVVEENHSLAQMRRRMPYTFSLARRYGYAGDYHALGHPSLPNYLGITSGHMYGVHRNMKPSLLKVGSPSVFGQALAAGRTAGVYVDSMPTPCFRRRQAPYTLPANPWVFYSRERSACLAHDRPMAAFAPDVSAGRLPQVGMVTPNLCHSGHDCPLSTADAWFERLMSTVTSGPDWRSGRLAIVLTADEDHHNAGNVVLTTVIHPSQSHHVVSARLTHYSLTRLFDEVAGLPPLGQAATAPSMAKAFGLPLSAPVHAAG